MPHEIRKISNFQRKSLPDWQGFRWRMGWGDSWMMGCEPPVRQTVVGRSMLKRLPRDLAHVILLTLACILSVLVPPLNETPVRVLLGLLLVLFLPGYSLIAALFPRKDDLDGTRADRTRLRAQYCSRATARAGIELHAVREQAWCRCLLCCRCSRSCLL